MLKAFIRIRKRLFICECSIYSGLPWIVTELLQCGKSSQLNVRVGERELATTRRRIVDQTARPGLLRNCWLGNAQGIDRAT